MEELDSILKSTPHSSDVIFTCTSGRGLYVHVWDLSNGGTLRSYYCEGEGEGASICMAGNDYILCALKTKPLILVWRIDREQVHLRFACSGLVSHMICDPLGVHCICSIGEKINIWEISSGLLLAQVSRHYQHISTLHYITGGCFVSGGKDSLVIVWNLASIVSDYRLSHSSSHPHEPHPLVKPKDHTIHHIWSSHSMAITAISHTSKTNHTRNTPPSFDNTIIITASMDQSCKLFSLVSGGLLCTLLFNAPITSLGLNKDWLYVGVASGNILATPLFLPLEKVKEVGKERYVSSFNGHKSPVTSLLVSTKGHKLISSSSNESTSKVWDINSTQLLLTVNHKGPVTSSLIRHDIWKFSQLHSSSSPSYSPLLILSPFQKTPQFKHDSIMNHNIILHKKPVHELSLNKMSLIDDLTGEDFLEQFHFHTTQQTLVIDDKSKDSLESEVTQLRQELSEMKQVNKELYTLAVIHLLNENNSN